MLWAEFLKGLPIFNKACLKAGSDLEWRITNGNNSIQILYKEKNEYLATSLILFYLNDYLME